MAMANGKPDYPKTRAALAAYFDEPTSGHADLVHIAFAEEAPHLSRRPGATQGQRERTLAVEAIWARILKAK